MNETPFNPGETGLILPRLNFDDSVEGRLFKAGWEVLMAGDGTFFDSGLNPERLAEAAGVSRRTFYRYFADKATYIEALMATVVELSFTSQPLDSLAEIVQATGGLRTVVASVATKYWESLCITNTVIARIVLLALGGSSSDLYEIARAQQQKSIIAQEPILAAVTNAWGVEPRPPWTLQTILVLIGSLFDGFMVRSVYHSETIDIGEMCGTVSVAIVPILFRQKSEAEDGLQQYQDDFFARLQAHVESLGHEPPADLSANVDAALLHALASRGLSGTTVLSLAVDARTTKERVAVMGNVAEQVCHHARVAFDAAAEELSFDLSLGTYDAEQVLERHRARIRSAAQHNEPVMRAFLQLRVANRHPLATDGALASIESSYDEFVEANKLKHAPSCAAVVEQQLSQILLGWGLKGS